MLIEGPGSLSQLPAQLADRGVLRPMLISGNRSFAAARPLLNHWLSEGHITHELKQGENVQQQEILNALKRFRQAGCDGVIGIGGGSVMDLAGPVALLASVDDEERVTRILAAKEDAECRSVALAQVPTTSGSGSEATRYAVTYHGSKKITLTSPALLPDIAVLDPSLTLPLSDRQLAISGIDAISQAIEGWWSVAATDQACTYSQDALKLLLPAIRQARSTSEENQRLDAHMAMLKGSYLAGCSINITKTTVPHALSYVLTSHFGVPHGQAVSFWLPRAMLHIAGVTDADCNDPRGAPAVQERLAGITAVFGMHAITDVAHAIVRLMKELNLAVNLNDLQVDRKRLLQLLNLFEHLTNL